MNEKIPQPGVLRNQRLSAAGLQRLEKHLAAGTGISPQVLAQWIRRYGEPARVIIQRHGRYSAALEDTGQSPE